MAAELQSPTEQPRVQNFAPLKPLTELQRGARRPDSYIAKAIKERFDYFHRKDTNIFREICNVGQLINLFANGKHFLMRNPIDGSWGALPLKDSGPSSQRALNIMRNLVQNLLGKWENSNPDIIIRPGRNLDTVISAAKAADTVNNYYERDFYNHWFSQQEGLLGMTFGTYIDRYRFDDAKVSMSVISEIFEQKEVTLGQGIAWCAECGASGAPEQFQPPQAAPTLGGDGPLMRQGQCPHCGSTAVDIQRAPSGTIPSVAGQQQRQIGDLVCETLPLPACRWDLAKRPEESSYFIYRQDIAKGAIHRLLGNVLIPGGDGERDYGLEVLRALGLQGSAVQGRSAYGNVGQTDEKRKADTIQFDEFWMSPDNYADINLIGDEKTVEGDVLPKGKLTDVFPDGLCAVGLNGMSVVLALYPEQHRKHIVSGTWFMQAATGAGRGIADTVEVQKQFNTLNNQALEYMSSTYTPAVMYDNQILTGTKMKYLGTPRTNIPVDLTKLPDGRKLADAIHQFQPTAMPAQFFNYAQNFLNVMFQKTSMVSDFANGEPGITAQNTTATAAEIDQGNADAINQPIFLIKADCRKRGAEITVNLFRQHFPMKRYFDLGGQYGRQQGIELSAADLQADLIYGIAKGSEMPKGPFQKQKNRMQFMAAVGGGAGLSQLQMSDPETINEMKQEFDVDMLRDDHDEVNEICLRRLEQMQSAEKAGVDLPEVLMMAIRPPISMVELDLEKKSEWFARWLSTDQGQAASMPLRAACEMLAQGQFQGAVQQQAQIAMAQGAVQAASAAIPAMGQAAMNQQEPQVDPQAEMQAQQEAVQQQGQFQENERQRQHEKKTQESQQKHELKASKVDADNKIRIERAKPKSKPAAKAGSKK